MTHGLDLNYLTAGRCEVVVVVGGGRQASQFAAQMLFDFAERHIYVADGGFRDTLLKE